MTHPISTVVAGAALLVFASVVVTRQAISNNAREDAVIAVTTATHRLCSRETTTAPFDCSQKPFVVKLTKGTEVTYARFTSLTPDGVPVGRMWSARAKGTLDAAVFDDCWHGQGDCDFIPVDTAEGSKINGDYIRLFR